MGRLGTRVVGVPLLECYTLLTDLQQIQLPAQGMVKRLAVMLKEVMEADPMLTMLTENQHLFHLGLLRQCPPRCRPHTTPPAPPKDRRS